MIVRSALAGVLCVLAAALSGCASHPSPDTYSVGSVGQASRAVRATVLQARPVTVQSSGVGGAAVGATGGAIAGSFVGGDWRGNALGALGGAVIGGVIGAAVEQGASRQPAWEYVLQTDNDALLTIVQPGEVPLTPGTLVYVLYGQPNRLVIAS